MVLQVSQLWMRQETGKNPDIGISDRAERRSTHQSAASQPVEKLVVRSLIEKERSQEDQRRPGLRLTATAKTILPPGPAEGIVPEALQVSEESVLLASDNALIEAVSQLRLLDDKLADRPLSDL